MPKLSLDQDGFVKIRVWIQPRALDLDYQYVIYKLDTGANRTTIDLKRLYKLGYDINWIRENGKLLQGVESPTVATGEAIDDCYSICLPEIRIGKYTGENWHFVVSLNKRVQFRYLFGTDSMQFFNWNFNFEKNICEYNVIEDKKRVLFNKQNQMVSALDDIDK